MMPSGEISTTTKSWNIVLDVARGSSWKEKTRLCFKPNSGKLSGIYRPEVITPHQIPHSPVKELFYVNETIVALFQNGGLLLYHPATGDRCEFFTQEGTRNIGDCSPLLYFGGDHGIVYALDTDSKTVSQVAHDVRHPCFQDPYIVGVSFDSRTLRMVKPHSPSGNVVREIVFDEPIEEVQCSPDAVVSLHQGKFSYILNGNPSPQPAALSFEETPKWWGVHGTTISCCWANGSLALHDLSGAHSLWTYQIELPISLHTDEPSPVTAFACCGTSFSFRFCEWIRHDLEWRFSKFHQKLAS